MSNILAALTEIRDLAKFDAAFDAVYPREFTTAAEPSEAIGHVLSPVEAKSGGSATTAAALTKRAERPGLPG